MTEHIYSERFEKIFGSCRRVCALCGADIIDKNYKVSWKTIFTFMLLNLAVFVTGYTVYIEVIVKGDFHNLFRSFSLIGSGIQGYAKLITAIKKKNNFRYLYKEIKGIYEAYELKPVSYRKCLKYNISLVNKILVTVFGIVITTSLIIIGVPAVMTIILKKHVEILPYQMPFVDIETDFGFYFTTCSHIVFIFFAAFGNFASDSLLFIYVGQIPLMKNILKCKFDELDAISEANPKDVVKSKSPLNEIFKWHQKYLSLSNSIRDTFFWVILAQVGTEFFGIACTIVCVFLGIWTPAPAFAFYLFSMIYSYCALGNLVEAANDDVIEMIYDSCWYNLTVAEQKMILIMLRESQQATGLTIGGVAPLSLNTALQLTKTIYTFSMMLKEFFD